MCDCCITDTMYGSDFFPANRQKACFVLLYILPLHPKTHQLHQDHTHILYTHTEETVIDLTVYVAVCECIIGSSTENRRWEKCYTYILNHKMVCT